MVGKSARSRHESDLIGADTWRWHWETGLVFVADPMKRTAESHSFRIQDVKRTFVWTTEKRLFTTCFAVSTFAGDTIACMETPCGTVSTVVKPRRRELGIAHDPVKSRPMRFPNLDSVYDPSLLMVSVLPR